MIDTSYVRGCKGCNERVLLGDVKSIFVTGGGAGGHTGSSELDMVSPVVIESKKNITSDFFVTFSDL